MFFPKQVYFAFLESQIEMPPTRSTIDDLQCHTFAMAKKRNWELVKIESVMTYRYAGVSEDEYDDTYSLIRTLCCYHGNYFDLISETGKALIDLKGLVIWTANGVIVKPVLPTSPSAPQTRHPISDVLSGNTDLIFQIPDEAQPMMEAVFSAQELATYYGTYQRGELPSHSFLHQLSALFRWLSPLEDVERLHRP